MICIIKNQADCRVNWKGLPGKSCPSLYTILQVVLSPTLKAEGMRGQIIGPEYNATYCAFDLALENPCVNSTKRQAQNSP